MTGDVYYLIKVKHRLLNLLLLNPGATPRAPAQQVHGFAIPSLLQGTVLHFTALHCTALHGTELIAQQVHNNEVYCTYQTFTALTLGFGNEFPSLVMSCRYQATVG